MIPRGKKTISTYVDSDFHERVSSKARENGLSISDYVYDTLGSHLENPNKGVNVSPYEFYQSSGEVEDMTITEGDRKLIVTEVVKELQASLESGVGKDVRQLQQDLSSISGAQLQQNLSSISGTLGSVSNQLSELQNHQHSICKDGECFNAGISQIMGQVDKINEGVGSLVKDAFSVTCPECGEGFMWDDSKPYCPHCGVPLEEDV